MSGLYNPNFSPARAASPQIRTSSDVDRYNNKLKRTVLFHFDDDD